MKKIMFNDRFGLTQAVLEGRKTQTRRIIKTQPPYKNFDIAFPVFEEEDWHTNPLYGAFCWVDKDNTECHTDWIRPQFKDGKVVAVAQSYHDCGGLNEQGLPQWEIIAQSVGSISVGWNNKIFVRANLMPHQIHITNVRIERLQDISDEDCLKEGIYAYYYGDEKEKRFYEIPPNGYSFDGTDYHYPTPREAFAHLIDKVSGKGTWERDPYVWVYDFELIK